MFNSTTTDQAFVQDYIEAWSTGDPAERTQSVARLYTNDAVFYADEPGDKPVKIRGHADITANIAQVNQRLCQDNGLTTHETGFSANHDSLKVSWQMKTPQGDTAMAGTNLLIRNAEGQILQDYIFIG